MFEQEPLSILFRFELDRCRPKEDPDDPPPLDLRSTTSESASSPTPSSPAKQYLNANDSFSLVLGSFDELPEVGARRIRSQSESIPALIYTFLDRKIK